MKDFESEDSWIQCQRSFIRKMHGYYKWNPSGFSCCLQITIVRYFENVWKYFLSGKYQKIVFH